MRNLFQPATAVERAEVVLARVTDGLCRIGACDEAVPLVKHANCFERVGISGVSRLAPSKCVANLRNAYDATTARWSVARRSGRRRFLRLVKRNAIAGLHFKIRTPVLRLE